MNLFKKIIGSRTELYPELKPADRIRKVIELHIFPELENLGFKMLKCTLSITRNLGDFKQEIYFPKSKWNQGRDSVEFDLIFNITFPKYSNWHLNNYGFEPENIGVAGDRACYIKNWNMDLFSNHWYNLGKDDNQTIVELVKSNILIAGLEYFDSYSTMENTINTTINSNSYYYRFPILYDFTYLMNDKELAKRVLNWFEDYEKKERPTFDYYITKNIALRKEKIKEWL